MSDWGDGIDYTIPEWNSGYDVPSMDVPPIDTSGFGMGDRGTGTTDAGTAGGYTGGPSGVQPQAWWSGLGGSAQSGLTSLAKALGMTNKDGSVNLGSLMSMLGPLIGGVTAYNATDKATGQMQDAITNANKIVTDTLGGNQALYAPYTAAGTTALGNLAGLGYKPQAGNFQSLGAGRGMTLGKLAGR